jgi:hypothetical protein
MSIEVFFVIGINEMKWGMQASLAGPTSGFTFTHILQT